MVETISVSISSTWLGCRFCGGKGRIMADRKEWAGFRGTAWKEEVNTRDFIQNNYTVYDGDESFLAGPTDATASASPLHLITPVRRNLFPGFPRSGRLRPGFPFWDRAVSGRAAAVRA